MQTPPEEMCKATKVTLGYKGKEYTFLHSWGENYPEDGANYMFEQGNYSCDCNKKIFLRRECGLDIDTEEEHACGQEIRLVDLEHIK